jgi:hypothetical protein
MAALSWGGTGSKGKVSDIRLINQLGRLPVQALKALTIPTWVSKMGFKKIMGNLITYFSLTSSMGVHVVLEREDQLHVLRATQWSTTQMEHHKLDWMQSLEHY